MQPDWEIWLDHNLSPIIARCMSEDFGMTVKSSYALQIQNLTDFELYRLARNHGKVVVLTKDADLAEIVTRLGAPPKLIHLRVGNRSSASLYAILKTTLPEAFRLLDETPDQVMQVVLDFTAGEGGSK